MSEAVEESPILLRTDRLSKTYTDGQVRAVVAVSFTVRRGEYVAITGPSGCGKFDAPELAGRSRHARRRRGFFRRAVAGDDGKPRRVSLDQDRLYLSVVPPVPDSQSHRERPGADVRRTLVGRGTRRQGQTAPRRSRLEPPALPPAKQAFSRRTTTRGHRARLANDPPLLLADEPTGNLDSKTAAEVLDLFDRVRADRQVTLIVVTHSETLARRATRILKLLDGRLEGDFRQSGGTTNSHENGEVRGTIAPVSIAPARSQRPETPLDISSF